MWCPSECLVWLLDPLGVSTSDRPLRIGCSFRVPHSPAYRPYWLSDPTLPLAVSSAVWFSKNRRASLVTFQFPDRALSSSCASVQSVTQPYLANRSQPVGSSHGLLFPTAREGSKVYLTRACQPATFRLQGLVTLLAAYSLRSRAGSVSHRQRSWDSPFGAFSSRKVSGRLPPEWSHLPFNLSVLPTP